MSKLKEKKIFPIFKATAKGGRLIFDDDISGYLLNLEGKDLRVIIKGVSKRRSRQEEKFYHGVVVKLVAEAMSIGFQEAHEFMKSLFLRVEEKTPGGTRFERILSTTELSDSAYREYWTACQRWASLPTLDGGLSEHSGLEIYIPDPNEVDYSHF